MIDSSPNRKIVLIIPSLRHGGAERVITILANQWAKDPELDITLLILTKQVHYYKLDDRVTIIEPLRTYNNNSISKFLYTLWSLKFIRAEVSKIKPDAILSFCEIYNNLVLLALFGMNYEIFVSDRNNPDNNQGFLHENLRKLLYKNASGIIAQTKNGKEILYRKTKSKNIVNIPNPLRPINEFDSIKEKIILNVGRNEQQKNQLELIEIFAGLENAEDWKLYILGNGELRGQLDRKIEYLGLKSSVVLMDFQSDIDLYFQKSSIFAFPSLYEGFPNALSEAMANGLPCVVYDCPTGPAEMIENNINGFLVPLQDKRTFTIQLQLLVDNELLRKKIGIEAAKIKEKLAVDKICDEYLNVILKK